MRRRLNSKAELIHAFDERSSQNIIEGNFKLLMDSLVEVNSSNYLV